MTAKSDSTSDSSSRHGPVLLDCHVHTRLHSGCSVITPDGLCSAAIRRGVGGVVITEHQVRWDKRELDALRRNYPELRLYSGVEVSVAEGHDIVVIGPETGSMFGYGLPFELLLRELEPVRKETFLFVAHPFRFHPGLSVELDEILSEVDGMEMNSVNIVRGNARWQEGRIVPQTETMYRTARAGYDIRSLYNSDAHHEISIGAVANVIDVEALPSDEAGLAALLKTADCREHQDQERLRRILGWGGTPGIFE